MSYPKEHSAKGLGQTLSAYQLEEKDRFLKELGKRVKTRRELLGLTMDQLGRACGYTGASARSAMSKLEKGMIDLSVYRLKVLARELDVSEAYLMGWEPARQQTTIYEHIKAERGVKDADDVQQFLAFDEIDRAYLSGEMAAMGRGEKYKKIKAG